MAEVRHTEANSPHTQPRVPEAGLRETATARETPTVRETPTTKGAHSVPELISDLGRDITSLFSKEAGLLRAEVNEKFSNLQVAGGSLVAAGILLLVSLLILLQALIVWLTYVGLGAGWASLLVGAVVGIIGFGLLQYGRSLMNRGIMPTRTQTQVQRDAEMLKEQAK